jgi:thimet oligopeptidase
MERARTGLEAVKTAPAPPDTAATLTAYDDALAAVNDAAAQAELARKGSPDPEMRKAAEDCDRQLQAMFTAINQDRRALRGAVLPGPLGPGRHHPLVDDPRASCEFRRAGVDRDDATREKVAPSPTSW